MTRSDESAGVFAHASDVQLLNEEAVEQILRWGIMTVMVSGPPIYLEVSRQQ